MFGTLRRKWDSINFDRSVEVERIGSLTVA